MVHLISAFMLQKEKKIFSLLMIAKVSKVLNLSNIATTVENQVKVIQDPPVKEF